MESLLTVAEFSSKAGGWFEVPDTLPSARLLPHVVEAQRQRLKPVLGAALLAQLGLVVATARASAAAEMAAQTPANSSPVPFADYLAQPWALLWAAVKPLVGYAAWARYLPFAQTTVTSHSMVVKTADNSTPASSSTVNAQVVVLLDTARTYQAELEEVLWLAGPDLAPWLPPADACQPRGAQSHATVVTLLIRR